METIRMCGYGGFNDWEDGTHIGCWTSNVSYEELVGVGSKNMTHVGVWE